MGGSIRSEIQCLEGLGQNSHLSNDKVRIPVFGRIRSEFQCLDKKRIAVFGRIRSEFVCLEG